MKKIILFLLVSMQFSLLSGQDYRYTEDLFSSVQLNADVPYASVPYLNPGTQSTFHDQSSTTIKNVVMDIYRPNGDNFTERPAIIMVHAGAFLSGDKEHDDMVEFCTVFAKKGYVTASIQYRLGLNPLDNKSGIRGIYRSLQDARSAVRFLRKNASTYGIDPDRIYMLGSSAGAVMALHAIYMTKNNEKPSEIAAYSYQDPVSASTINAPDLGDFDIGDNLNENGTPDGVISLWGAVQHTNLITNTDTKPIFLVHGKSDTVVPFRVGKPFGFQNFIDTYGSNEINNKLNDLSFEDKETYFVSGAEHEFYGVSNGAWNNGTSGNAQWDIVLDKSIEFLREQHKPQANFQYNDNNLDLSFSNSSEGETSWLWDFGDGATSTAENPTHTYSSSGNYEVKLYVENSLRSWDESSQTIAVGSPASSTFTLTFEVNDGTNPISGASISINNQNLTTDNSGLATIDLEDGNYDYAVSANGFTGKNSSVSINGADKTVTISLEATTNSSTLTFEVNDGTNPISGANISINNQNLTTNSNGIAIIDLENGEYSYVVSANGFEDKAANVTINGNGKNINVQLGRISTGIDDEKNNGLIIYPNPASHKIIIESQTNLNDYELSIFTMAGSLVLTIQKLENKREIDISKFKKGVYFVSLKNSNGVYTQKLVIK